GSFFTKVVVASVDSIDVLAASSDAVAVSSDAVAVSGNKLPESCGVLSGMVSAGCDGMNLALGAELDAVSRVSDAISFVPQPNTVNISERTKKRFTAYPFSTEPHGPYQENDSRHTNTSKVPAGAGSLSIIMAIP
ncbi:MAG: hypothetical protein CMJ70_23195, partial [Planctomycetaceae bacterium]|nr:hypothetical protein [Planctomycetaceae bacterium]